MRRWFFDRGEHVSQLTGAGITPTVYAPPIRGQQTRHDNVRPRPRARYLDEGTLSRMRFEARRRRPNQDRDLIKAAGSQTLTRLPNAACLIS